MWCCFSYLGKQNLSFPWCFLIRFCWRLCYDLCRMGLHNLSELLNSVIQQFSNSELMIMSFNHFLDAFFWHSWVPDLAVCKYWKICLFFSIRAICREGGCSGLFHAAWDLRWSDGHWCQCHSLCVLLLILEEASALEGGCITKTRK